MRIVDFFPWMTFFLILKFVTALAVVIAIGCIAGMIAMLLSKGEEGANIFDIPTIETPNVTTTSPSPLLIPIVR